MLYITRARALQKILIIAPLKEVALILRRNGIYSGKKTSECCSGRFANSKLKFRATTCRAIKSLFPSTVEWRYFIKIHDGIWENVASENVWSERERKMRDVKFYFCQARIATPFNGSFVHSSQVDDKDLGHLIEKKVSNEISTFLLHGSFKNSRGRYRTSSSSIGRCNLWINSARRDPVENRWTPGFATARNVISIAFKRDH